MKLNQNKKSQINQIEMKKQKQNIITLIWIVDTGPEIKQLVKIFKKISFFELFSHLYAKLNLWTSASIVDAKAINLVDPFIHTKSW